MPANKPERQGSPPGDRGIPDERFVAARALYESTPGMTLAKVAAETGIGKSTLERRANTEGWKKNYTRTDLQPLTGAAHAAADKYQHKMAELGPEVTAEEKAAVVAEVVEEVAIDERAKILDRHRREWAAPRAMSAEAVRMRERDPDGAFARAKMAKITAETLKIVQDGERKAWGIDVGELPPNHVVVIERA